jgi:hypothetical protein
MRHSKLKFQSLTDGLVLIILLLIAVPAGAQQWTGIIAPSRAANWANVGAAGGTPATGGLPSDSWAQCTATACTSLATPANVTAANINTAIAGAPANTYIQLPAGSFTMSTGLVWNHKSNVELRGQGANQTFLSFTGSNGCQGTAGDLCFESSDTNYNYGPTNTANWTAGYAQGATSITLSSVTNLQVGWPVTLDQVDDTTDSGDIYICLTQNTCSYAGSGGASRTGRAQSQMVTVTSISGTGPYTVGISPGLYMPNWNDNPGTSLPQAWWATGPVFYDGVRNLSMDHSSSNPPNGVMFFNCQNCWVSGVRNIMPTSGSLETHVRLFSSNRITVQNSYFYRTAWTPTVQYGIEAFLSSDSLIQNNIFEGVSAPIPVNGSCSGCVVAYDFDVNNGFINGSSYTWLNQGEFLHAVADHVLFEGNEGTGLYSDNAHGTHHFQTIFRSAMNGFQQDNSTIPTQPLVPLMLDAFSRFYNVIGNVLGSPAVPHSVYQEIETQYQDVEIYDIGWGDEIPNDPNVQRTLMRWGNYSVVAQSSDTPTNSGIRFVSSEVPSGITNFANPVPSSNTLPPSFYLSSKPSWWGGSIPWPAVGPDVSSGNLNICVGGTNRGAYVLNSGQCPGSTLAGLAGRANAIPALNCYYNVMGGDPLGAGSALNFNATACYGAATSQLPVAPTSLKATVN